MFTAFLYRLRAEGVPVGTSEWLALLRGLAEGLATDLDGLYRLGRALLCRTEADYDAFDIAFADTFRGAALDPAVREKLESWLADAVERSSDELVDPAFSDAQLWEELLKRLAEQTERHDGGNHWVGTGGTSPFGHSGRAARGIRIGGPGGNRGAVQVADERQWASYRTDTTLETRDLTVALKALRKLQREGDWALDLPETIDRTCQNAGDIDLAFARERTNQVRLVLFMDAGGSMAPHAERVEQLFTAADEVGAFASFEAYFFHNCPYSWLWTDFEAGERRPTAEVLAELGPRHRLLFVGDASMAPYELFTTTGWGSEADRATGIEWLRRFRRRCPASAWLNPDPRRWWDHPTVSAVGQIFPMHELSVDGLKDAVAALRKPV
ncbi:MAG: VWA containing CoxE family protein [Alphaproteobacteria bacterium]|nr:VWA containing CoxE family protein [Alphaproteobacteria bacterium]